MNDMRSTGRQERAGRARTLAMTAAMALAACGGGDGSAGAGAQASDARQTALAATRPVASVPVYIDRPASYDEAARFAAQASFGVDPALMGRLNEVGYAAWIDEQFALPATSHRAHWEARDAAFKAVDPATGAGQDQIFESFWKQAVTGPDQLRQRVAYALSQIFVVSMVDTSVGDNPRAVAAWLDMLAFKGLGDYRSLIEAVSLHPMMGLYLSHLKNQKADPAKGRVPDENYAREVMQLFSIGLVQLNPDGTPRLDASGRTLDTYGPNDIAGLARVFTGWSWACPGFPADSCFSSGSSNGVSDPDRTFKPMLGYPKYHSTEAKNFLGVTIPAQGTANPSASLKVALDTLSAHPNVGPFIGRQLIQRLVTSNPSPAYVAAVAAVFANNGSGLRGDMKAVVKAILLHPEARQITAGGGKVREPVLRLAAYLRAVPHRSDTGAWRVGNTDNPGTSLGQTPLRAPSVFNYYRPGYVAPNSSSAAAGLVAPELQLVHETSSAGYVNFMRDNVSSGVGLSNSVVNGVTLNRRDLQPDLATWLPLATEPNSLVSRAITALVPGNTSMTSSKGLSIAVVNAVSSIVIPALKPDGSNQKQVDDAKRARVNAALLLVLASPEFQVQK